MARPGAHNKVYLNDPGVDASNDSVQHPEPMVLRLVQDVCKFSQTLINLFFGMFTLLPFFFAGVGGSTQPGEYSFSVNISTYIIIGGTYIVGLIITIFPSLLI